MKLTKKNKSKSRVLSILMLLLMLTGLYTPINVSALSSATIHEGDTITYMQYGTIWYGEGSAGYTNLKNADLKDGLGVRNMYCMQPNLPSPNGEGGGTIKITTIRDSDNTSTDKWNSIRNTLYYSPTYEGYEKNVAGIKSSGYYTGNFKTDSAIAHLAVSYAYDGFSDNCKGWGGHLVKDDTDPAIWQKAKDLANAMKKHSGDYNNSVPDSFKCIYTKVPECQDMVVGYVTPSGTVSVKKVSADSSVTNGNSCYSFEGAKFDVYDGSDKVGTLTANSDGSTNALKLEEGTYKIVESYAPKGYSNLDGDGKQMSKTVTIAAGEDKTVTFEDAPTMDPVNVVLNKIDKETGKTVPQGDGSLQGAVYKMEYFDNYEGTGTATRTWYFKTNSKGRIIFNNDSNFLADKSSPLYLVDGMPQCPLGSVLITEVTPPTGYKTNSKAQLVKITDDGRDTPVVNTYVTFDSEETPIRGGVEVQKVTADTMKQYPLGSSTHKGTTFEITNRSENAVRVDGKDYAPGEVVKTIKVEGDDGIAKTDADALPYGTYSIKETAVGEGNLLTDKVERTFKIEKDGDYFKYDLSNPFANDVKRGDVKFVKVEDGSLKRMAGVPFKITSKTTGESHIIVTDANGQASTSSKWALHSNNTNAGKTADDGIWFGDDGHGNMAKVNDDKGALPYDTYILDELPCDANEGHELITGVEFKISSDAIVSPERGYVNLGTITNDLKPPTLGTTATDSETKGHVSCADNDVTIIDKVDMKNLVVGRAYTVKGTLIDKSTGKAVTVGGKAVTSEKPFVALAQNMTIDMEFSFDGTDMKGKDVVVYEHLYQYGIEIAEHADINDLGQTITFPEIGTTAAKASNGIVDTVKYENLVVGETYKVSGILMDKATEQPLLINGQEVTAEAEFVAEKESGTVEVRFDVDETKLEGKTVVVFEELSLNGNVIGEHKDINDVNQTLEYPVPEKPTPKQQAPKTPAKEAGPQTGDASNIVMWVLIAGATLVIVGRVVSAKKNIKDKDNGEE